MEEDGFVLVKKGRRRTKADVVRADGSLEDIDEAMGRLAADEDVAKMVDWCSLRLDSFLDSQPISRILLLGNGHFDAKWESGAHQLAFALGLHKNFGGDLIFQEPSCSSAERHWLSSRGVLVRSERDVLIPPPAEGSELVIFIHGLHSLLNDFLLHRWDAGLERTAFVCNDYSKIDLIGGTRQLNGEYEALNAFRERAESLRLPAYGGSPSAFSGTSLMHFKGLFPEICRDTPTYTNVDG